MISSLKIWRASLMLKQSEGFLSQKKHWCAPWYSTMQKKKTNTLWLLQKIKTLCTRSKFQGCLYQHAEYLPCQSEQPRQLTGKPSEITWRTILFCFSPKNSLLGLGNWWSWQFPLQSATHQSNLNTNLHPNGFFVLPRDADVATAGISAANCEKKYIRVRRRWGTSICMWLACSYAHLNNSNVFVHNFF